MSTSSVSICSNALLLLGDDPISSFDEDNDRTRLVANLYDMKRDRVLRAHPWNCATKRVILAPDATAPAFGWDYQFTLPSDCLRVLSVGLDDEEPDDYRLENRKVLMDLDTCRLRYIWKNTNEATWDTLLIDAMTQVMVAACAYAVTKSTSKQELETAIIQRVLKEVRAVDAQENPAETFGYAPLLANRMR